MSTILVYSDLHAGCFAGRLDPNGIDVRVNDTLKIESDITEYCLQHGITEIIFTGDRFESRNPPMWMINMVDALWMDRIKKGINMKVILGNHDSYRVFCYGHSYSHLWVGVEGITIYSKPTCESIGKSPSRTAAFLPYGFPLSDIKGHVDFLFFHEAVIDHEDQRGFKSLDGYSYEEIQSKAHLFLGGHIHSQERIGPTGMYVGNPYQKDVLDIGKPRGFVLLDTEGTYSFEELNAPQIVELKVERVEDIQEQDVCGNYVKCLVPSGMERKAEVRILGLGARYAVVSPIRDKGFMVESLARKIYKQDQIDEIIREYVSSRELSNKDLIREAGIEIWKETV